MNPIPSDESYSLGYILSYPPLTYPSADASSLIRVKADTLKAEREGNETEGRESVKADTLKALKAAFMMSDHESSLLCHESRGCILSYPLSHIPLLGNRVSFDEKRHTLSSFDDEERE